MDATTLFAGLGVTASLYLTLRFLRFLHLYTRPSSLPRYHHGRSPWALVTGASDGIGLAFAHQLAAQDFNILLHGRNAQKLETAHSRLTAAFPTLNFRIIVADASDASSAQIKDIVAKIGNLNLTILINNVGGGSVCKPFEDYTFEETDTMMNVNARFPTQLTCALLPRFTRKDAGACLIMNMGSLGTAGVPYAVPYGGAKAFNVSMSASLEVEMRVEGKLGVEVLAVQVGAVTGVSHRGDAATVFTPGAGTMARAALGRVGCGRAEVVGYVGHAVQKFVADALPRWARESVLVPVMVRYKEEHLRSR